MDPLNQDKHKRKNPFDLVDDEFDRLFDEVLQMPGVRETMDEIFNEINMLPGRNRNVHEFYIEIRSWMKQQVSRNSGVHPLKQLDTKIEKHEMVTDIIEDNKEVAVTVELPGVEKEDINLNVTEDTLEITVDNPKRKHHKRLGLPCSVKPNTMNFTYKNGILDIIIKKDKSR